MFVCVIVSGVMQSSLVSLYVQHTYNILILLFHIYAYIFTIFANNNVFYFSLFALR